MERIEKILHHRQYRIWLENNAVAEKDRIFCRHDLEHSLAVARISYILWLEQQGDPKEKPYFYGAALLHDIGKWQKKDYPEKDHGALSAALAQEILGDCGFNKKEQEKIIRAILWHSGSERRAEIAQKEIKTFEEVFYLADKLSRDCWRCAAQDACYWPVKNESWLY